jgi:Holliday junction resolvase RusA-like endonuclease
MGKPLRKRAHKSFGRNRIVDPDRSIKQQLSDYINENYNLNESCFPMTGALSIHLVAYFKIPKSCSKKEKADRLSHGWAHDVRIDMDNCVKLYADILQFGSLEGKIFFDDHQFCKYSLEKVWTEQEERVSIVIKNL